MNHIVSRGFISILLLVFLAGAGLAEEPPMKIVFVQGGASIITTGSDDLTEITIQDIIPYVHIADGEKSRLIPIQNLTPLPFPLNAAVVFSGEENESASLVSISNLSLSDDGTALLLQLTPVQYYEGAGLSSVASGEHAFSIPDADNAKECTLYIESPISPVENSGEMCCMQWGPNDLGINVCKVYTMDMTQCVGDWRG